MEPHWTDDATSPVFESRIRATGAGGNIFVIVGTACRMMRKLGLPADRIEKLQSDVMASGSYDEAIAFVERWFPVDRDDDR